MSNLTVEQRKEVEEQVRIKAVAGRISCGQARAIASTLALPIKTVGSIIDDMKIKISQCELGCF